MSVDHDYNGEALKTESERLQIDADAMERMPPRPKASAKTAEPSTDEASERARAVQQARQGE